MFYFFHFFENVLETKTKAIGGGRESHTSDCHVGRISRGSGLRVKQMLAMSTRTRPWGSLRPVVLDQQIGHSSEGPNLLVKRY